MVDPDRTSRSVPGRFNSISLEKGQRITQEQGNGFFKPSGEILGGTNFLQRFWRLFRQVYDSCASSTSWQKKAFQTWPLSSDTAKWRHAALQYKNTTDCRGTYWFHRVSYVSGWRALTQFSLSLSLLSRSDWDTRLHSTFDRLIHCSAHTIEREENCIILRLQRAAHFIARIC